jgi:hypothetical protein
VGRIGGAASGTAVVPVLLLAFFLPAQVALLIQLVRARGLISAREARRGFAAEAPIATAQPLIADAAETSADPVPVAREVPR